MAPADGSRCKLHHVRRHPSPADAPSSLMARPLRVVLPGVPVHVVQRGNNRLPTFGSRDDFARYREFLHQVSGQFGCAIHAYVFMTNHVHLLLTPLDNQAVSRMMKMLGNRYVRYMNTRYHRTGGLWDGRFKSSVIDSERYLLTCARYIELNPVRARMVPAPDQYEWSSYRRNAYGHADRLITSHSVYDALGPSADARQCAYRGLFTGSMADETLDEIRNATRTGAVLGKASFRLRHGGDRKSRIFKGSDPLIP
jgi:putative transposase